ncbi:SPT3, positive regulator of Ty transcription [Trichophaea hybrida]|nr:SPT3, positive regulator of Ty transcription [Trichophaea hybrida]
MSEKDKFKYKVEIQQMMFVSGETGEPSPETTGVIEEMVRGQVIEMLLQCTQLAARRGSRSISTDDLIFLIRHDKAKVSRLRTYLSWKDVRKTAKEQDPQSGGGGAEPGDLMEEAAAGIGTASGPSATIIKQKKTKVGLPWEVGSFFSETVPEREDDEDEDEIEANAATLQRLKNADERTRGMTRDEYVHWSECRQASFTFRKGKRFREWAGFGIVTEAKPNDDIVDILGFLTFEIVQTLTEEALKVKEQEDAMQKEQIMRNSKKRKREEFLFHAQEGRTPIEAKHVVEAFRRLQAPKPKSRAMKNFSGGVMKSRLSLV